MKDSMFFSCLDLAHADRQLELKEEDKPKTALGIPLGDNTVESDVCTFGISTIPAVFSATLGDELGKLLSKDVQEWLDDIALHTKTLEEYVA